MKNKEIVSLIGIVLICAAFTPAKPAGLAGTANDKNAIVLTIDKPILEFVADASARPLASEDLVRMQKTLGQIDYVTVSFSEKDSKDYVLKFKELDEEGLESWMFDEGYLSQGASQTSNDKVAAAQPAASKGRNSLHLAKKSVKLTIDKPLIEFLSNAYGEKLDSADIVRMQRFLGKVEQVRITFTDPDAADYILTFKPLDAAGLEAWMFNEGYLVGMPDAQPDPPQAWMENMTFER